ncbi:MAG: peptidoglycan-binding domain-containing protein [Rhabdaerophilum sp.]
MSLWKKGFQAARPGFGLVATLLSGRRALPALAILPLLLAAPLPGQAQAPAPSPGQAAPKPVDPLFAAAEKTYLALDIEVRKQIQRDLIWVAKFPGTTTGDFGPLTFAALKRFEEAEKLKPGESLSEPARRRLAEAGTRARAALGFAVQTDKSSSMQVGIPLKLLTKFGTNGSGGPRWQDAGEKVTVDLSVLKPEDTLPALFEKGTDPKVQGRKITYKLLRPDFFVISGETDKGKFFRRVASDGKGPLRALSIGYDKTMAATIDPLVVAIAASFDPWPAAKPGTAPAETARPPLVAAAPPRRRATGLVLGPDLVVTGDAALTGCTEFQARTAPDAAPLALRNPRKLDGTGLIALSGRIGKPLALPFAAAAAEGALIQRDAEGELLVAAADLAGGKASTSLQDGGAGAIVLDRSGQLVGIIAASPVTKVRVAGIVPVLSYPMLPAAELARAAGITPPAGGTTTMVKSGAELGELVRPALVGITCASDR